MTLTRTPSQTVGPFFEIGLCRRPENQLADPGAPDAVQLIGTLFDGQGAPIDDGVIEIWDAAGRRWGRSGTDGEGLFRFVVTKPEPVAGNAPPHVVVARNGVVRLVGLRWADLSPRPFAFSVRFCAAWCSLPLRAAGNAVRQLRDQDVIRLVRYAAGCPLYWPGRGRMSHEELIARLKTECGAVELDEPRKSAR